MPVRFVSEALGATVMWDPLSRVVSIAPFSVHSSPSVTTTPLNPPKEGPAEGTVVQVDLGAASPTIIITWYGVQTRAFTIAADTLFFRRDLTTNRVEPILAAQIFPGDAISLIVEVGGGPRPRGTIRWGEVIVREEQGRVRTVTDRTLTLEDGRSFALADQARFVVGGKIVPRPDLSGRQVIVRLHPLTRQVVEIEVTE